MEGREKGRGVGTVYAEADHKEEVLEHAELQEAVASVGADRLGSTFVPARSLAGIPRCLLRQPSSAVAHAGTLQCAGSSSSFPFAGAGRFGSASSSFPPLPAATASEGRRSTEWNLNHQHNQQDVWKLKVAGGDGMNGCYRQQQRRWWRRSLLVGVAFAALFFLLVNWRMLSLLEEFSFHQKATASGLSSIVTPPSKLLFRRLNQLGKGRRPHGVLHARLLSLAAHALAEGDGKNEPQELWREHSSPSLLWTPCSDKHLRGTREGGNGYILVSANGGISQQRIAICNAVAVARLLNSTLVIPKFLYSSVWSDPSQFSDIYQEDFFIDYLKGDLRIVKELPLELRSLDLEAIGSLVTDTDITKESKPSFFLKTVLPILIKNRVVHFVGFGNRLAFDPLPFNLQRLRCKCNFHALRFVRKIQETGALLVQRMRNHTYLSRPLDQNLVGPFASKLTPKGQGRPQDSRYLAVHLRFEIDMAAYSMCYFGGGKEEEDELEAYRSVHFPALTHLKNTTRLPSAAQLRSEGQCPLTPEEAVLMLAALGFKRKTRIYVAGANIYGGRSRMVGLSSLYPNLVTKESLLSSSEIEPFLNLSSQLAVLDFIVCAAADSFAMTDSGSQFSSLVSGHRMYYGSGVLPTIRPNKRRLASVFSRNSTIEWSLFERSIRKALRQMKRTVERPIARSIYRHPRCIECMCRSGSAS